MTQDFRDCFNREPTGEDMVIMRDMFADIAGILDNGGIVTRADIRKSFVEASNQNIIKMKYVRQVFRNIMQIGGVNDPLR